AERGLGTEMKATGEVMAIEKTIAGGIQKAIRSLGLKLDGLSLRSLKKLDSDTLKEVVNQVDDRRFFAIIELLKRGMTVEEIHEMTNIAIYFLECFASLVLLEKNAQNKSLTKVTKKELLHLKEYGFTNEQ